MSKGRAGLSSLGRRRFLQALAGTAGAVTLWQGADVESAEEYTGRFLVTLQLDGAWDATSFCDPKMNVPGELEINHWARTGEIQTAGNLRYAPFGKNATLFQRHYRDMLVINGVDSQTNSHTTGVTFNWSGRIDEGYPSLPALFSRIRAPAMPLSYITNGGFADTAGVTRFVRMTGAEGLRGILRPNEIWWTGRENHAFLDPADFKAINEAQQRKLAGRKLDALRLPRDRRQMQGQYEAMISSPLLQRYAEALPSDAEVAPRLPGKYDAANIRQQTQLAVIAFAAGVAVAADLWTPGFDTHDRHDMLHTGALDVAIEGLLYLWEYAEARGIADRLTVLVGSDFGRTPYYNSGDGKDHWAIGSTIVMQRDAPWANRVVGLTDGGHNAFRINPRTLQRDDAAGILIHPRHIHHAMRNLLGIAAHPLTQKYPFGGVETIDFFNPAIRTSSTDDEQRNSIRVA